MAALIAWAWLGAVVSSPTIGAHTLCLLPLQVTCTMTSANGSISILGALLVTGESFEASFACALSTLGSLLGKILVANVAASVS